MKSPQEMDDEMDELTRKVNRSVEIAKDKLRVFFRDMTPEQRITELRLWPDDQIIDFCERIALESEDYEICEAVYIVKNERGLK